MSSIKSFSELTGRWFAVIVLLAVALALAIPGAFSGATVAIPWLLSVIMLGMGMTLKLSDFAIIAKRPWALLLGVASQYPAEQE